MVLHFQVWFCFVSFPLITFFKESILYLRFTGQKSIMITMFIFVFIIPHSYTVSVWKAASMRHRASRRWVLGILLGRKQERSDLTVSGPGVFSVSKVTRLPFDSGTLLVRKEHPEGLLLDTRQTLSNTVD